MGNTRRDSHTSDVVADINYFPALGTPISKSEWKTRYLGDRDEFTRSMIIHDVRNSDKQFDLDTNGFQFVQLPPKNRISLDDEEETVKREYYPELEHLAKQLYIHKLTMSLPSN